MEGNSHSNDHGMWKDGEKEGRIEKVRETETQRDEHRKRQGTSDSPREAEPQARLD